MNILHDTCRLVFVYLGRLPEYGYIFIEDKFEI